MNSRRKKTIKKNLFGLLTGSGLLVAGIIFWQTLPTHDLIVFSRVNYLQSHIQNSDKVIILLSWATFVILSSLYVGSILINNVNSIQNVTLVSGIMAISLGLASTSIIWAIDGINLIGCILVGILSLISSFVIMTIGIETLKNFLDWDDQDARYFFLVSTLTIAIGIIAIVLISGIPSKKLHRPSEQNTTATKHIQQLETSELDPEPFTPFSLAELMCGIMGLATYVIFIIVFSMRAIKNILSQNKS